MLDAPDAANGDAADSASVPELDPPGLHLRDGADRVHTRGLQQRRRTHGRDRKAQEGDREVDAGGHRAGIARRHAEAAVAVRRRRADRERADAVQRRAADGVHLVAGGLRDGLHLLRHRPDGLQARPERGRDLRAGGALRAGGTPNQPLPKKKAKSRDS